MRLLSLRLRHFKGCASITLEAGGADLSVYGDNGTGKTTLADALAWLLTGKDARGNAPGGKEFPLRPLRPDGVPAPGLECEVEAAFALDSGEPLRLHKIHKEVWTKKRGAAAKEFGGYTVDHFVNGVPVQEKDYLAQVEAVAPAKTIRLLTSPLYFPEQMDWKARRALLLEVCGDVTDEQVIASDPALAELPELLAAQPGLVGKSKDEALRATIAARRAEINKRQVEIPARIDELNRTLQGVIFDATEDEAHAQALREKREALQRSRAQVEAGGAGAELTVELRKAEAEVRRIQNALEDEAAQARRWAEGQAAERRRMAGVAVETARTALSGLRNRAQQHVDDAAAWGRQQTRLEAENNTTRDAFNTLAAEVWSGAETCPTCQQPLPAGQVEAARAAWNQQKAERLEHLQAEGVGRKGEIDSLALKIAEAEAAGRALAEDIRLAEAALAEAEEALTAVKAEVLPAAEVEETTELRFARQSVANLQARLEGSRTTVQPELARIGGELETLGVDLRATEGRIAAAKEGAKAQTRIERLQAEQRALGAEFERLEGHLALLDAFLKAKVSLLEESINSRFEIARFKLFNQLVNGGLEPCCEVLCGGVPFGGANTGSRINVGLDIIRTLGEHFGLCLPVCADNAESVTALLPIPAQVIRLVVSESDKTLRVETDAQMSNRRKAA